jgi:pimeloyl-ACP methyl ester carboxylesterase
MEDFMASIVLVSGAWLGGWCWQAVGRRLRDRGHDVYPITLTGLGERAHLASPSVSLETHIADIVNVLEYEDLHDVLLLGHSYGGTPVTGAADRAFARIAKVVYLDSAPIPADSAFLDAWPPEGRAHVERQVAEHGEGWRLPMPSWEELETVNGASLAGLDDAQRARMRARATSQPFATYTQPLRLSNPGRTPLPSVAIFNSFTIAQVRELQASGHPWGVTMSGPEWRFVELPTGHWPMFSIPEALADLLHGLATETRLPA